jgi:cyclomaltodextrinase / maltogenic alpha-amylase / neopullulanase
MKFKPGIYKHFKGHVYKALYVAQHSESLDEMVVYVNVENEADIWVRPLSMFNDTVVVNGIAQKRFEFVGELK